MFNSGLSYKSSSALSKLPSKSEADGVMQCYPPNPNVDTFTNANSW